MKFTCQCLFIYFLISNVFVKPDCDVTTNAKEKLTSKVTCTKINSLHNHFDKINDNVSEILSFDADVQNVPSHIFAKFGATLTVLDMHDSNITTIDPQAFVGLTKLEKLILRGNKLTWVFGDWFINTSNLKILDVSFNFISGIEYTVFPRLPSLEVLYFDYNQLKWIDFNMFPYLGKLKKARFGKNPWTWAYRARLSWQMDNQKVDYRDDWEEWEWMNVVIRHCVETEQQQIPSDKILDCVLTKLLDFASDNEKLSGESMTDGGCLFEARSLIRCSKPENVSSGAVMETVRGVLQGYTAVLPLLQRSRSRFSIPKE